jgi:hypothetical protein
MPLDEDRLIAHGATLTEWRRMTAQMVTLAH